jgi:hypothetical protein
MVKDTTAAVLRINPAQSMWARVLSVLLSEVGAGFIEVMYKK